MPESPVIEAWSRPSSSGFTRLCERAIQGLQVHADVGHLSPTLEDWARRLQAQWRARRDRSTYRATSGRDLRRRLVRGAGSARADVVDEPIFLFAAGWRSGSTLLQRLICSSGEALLYGEPLTQLDWLGYLYDSARALTPGYPPLVVRAETVGDLTGSWIARLSPPVTDLYRAHVAHMRTLLAEPAERLGFARWGLKEVRFGADHAHYLRALFPRAKFVFLLRHPLAAWCSYRRARRYYLRWPVSQVRSASAFGRLWADFAGGFLREARDLDALVIRTEDVVQDRESGCRALEQRLGLEGIDRRTVDLRLRGSMPQPGRVSLLESQRLWRRVRSVAVQAGYTRDGDTLPPPGSLG